MNITMMVRSSFGHRVCSKLLPCNASLYLQHCNFLLPGNYEHRTQNIAGNESSTLGQVVRCAILHRHMTNVLITSNP